MKESIATDHGSSPESTDHHQKPQILTDVAIGSSLAPASDKKSMAMRLPFLLLGFLFVGLGYVGVIVPGMPTTIFMILAVWAFKKSSPRFESWLLNHRVFGPTLRDWDEHRAITLKTKYIAIATMVGFASVSIFFIKKPLVQAIVGFSVLCVAIYVATRKTKA